MSGRFDVLVVGGGSAGCVLAARLSEDPHRRVCLLEAGPDYGPYEAGRWPADLLDARILPLSHLWEQEPEDRSASRARILGGCSAHNACAVVWGSRSDYDEWGDGWSFARLEPHLRRAEAALRTRRDREGELAPWHLAMLRAAQELGLPPLDDLNDLDSPVGAAPAPVNAVGPVRWNTAFAYLDPARGRPNLELRAGTLADRVLSLDGRAVGVATDHGPVAAGLVVLAAGAYGSPALLLRSGIGPADDLRRLGIAPVVELPVGLGLADHPGIGLQWQPSEALEAASARHDPERFFEPGVVVKARSRSCPEDTCDLHVLPWTNPAADGRGYEVSAVVYVLDPDSRGSVRLRSRDPREPPAIDHGFLTDATARDAERLRDGLELCRRLGERAGAVAELRPGAAADVDSYLRAEVRGSFHPTGTCRMGDVVDAGGRVLGLEGLVVADASIVPTIPRANTNLTVVALAERIAELLRVAA